jgi:hypothetical protein
VLSTGVRRLPHSILRHRLVVRWVSSGI